VLPAIIPADRGTTEPIKAGFLDGTAIAAQIGDGERLAGVAGALATPDTTDLPAGVSGTPLRAFADLFYFRIWPIPAVLDVQNPKRNTPIPFKLWNAFLTANTLERDHPDGRTGITLDVAPGLRLYPAGTSDGQRSRSATTAPINIDAFFRLRVRLQRHRASLPRDPSRYPSDRQTVRSSKSWNGRRTFLRITTDRNTGSRFVRARVDRS
jgi:hypothetical protein